jgi:hypothetical protein
MESRHLTPEQARRIVAQIRPVLAYLPPLVKRMDKRRFPSDDPLLLVALKAQDAVHELHVHAHYLSCTSGVRQLPAFLQQEQRDDDDQHGPNDGVSRKGQEA